MIDEKLLDEVILQVFKKRLAAELRNFALYNDNKDVGEIYAAYIEKSEKLQKEIDLAAVASTRGPTGNRPPPAPPNPAALEKDDADIYAFWARNKEAEKQEPAAVVEEVSHNGYLYREVVWKIRPHELPIGTEIHTTPQQRTWVGLTNEEIYEAVKDKEESSWRVIVDAIEAKLKEKNA
jgi:hypothetical protein